MQLCSFPKGRSELVTWLLLILEWQADWRVLVFCSLRTTHIILTLTVHKKICLSYFRTKVYFVISKVCNKF